MELTLTADVATLGTQPMITISSGTFGNTTNIPLTGLENIGDSFYVDHPFRFPGEYDVYCKIFNLVSSEEYFCGRVSGGF